MKASELTHGFGLLAPIVFVVAMIGGWIANVMTIANTVADPLSGMLILRCIGVFVAPLGAVLGFF
jgi:hypothetical protein